MRPQSRTQKLALSGILFALALVLGYLESFLAPLLGLPPGVKIGLANVVVLYALLLISRRQAFFLVILKACFALLLRGAIAGALSLLGGLFSFCAMALLVFFGHKQNLWLLSVLGAICHNMGQLLGIGILMGSFSFYYAPVLLVSALVMGSLCAFLLRFLIPAMQNTKTK